MTTKYPYIWFWKVKLPERKNKPCRVLVRAYRMNSALLEFEDGFKVVSSLNAIRKRKEQIVDKQILKDQIAGTIVKGEKLREDEAVFLKLQGINETIVKTEIARDKNVALLKTEKENKKTLLAKKTAAVSSAAIKIVEKMNEVLPEKNGVFDCVNGLVMGMRNDDDSVTAYNSLSGGQLQAFNAALANVLDANILVIECAEIDNNRLGALMEDLAGSDKQIILNTCHSPGVVPEVFEVVEL